MLETRELEDLNEIKKKRKMDTIIILIAYIAVGLFGFLDILPLALLSLFIGLFFHTEIRYWDTKRYIIKYNSKGGDKE